MAKKKKTEITIKFNDQLLLFRYFLNLFGKNTLASLAGQLNSMEQEGYNENQNTWFYVYLDRICTVNKDIVKINRDKLRLYDENICRYVKQIGDKRGGIVLKYFQYISLLFTEMYLDRYFFDKDEFCKDLNEYAKQVSTQTMGKIDIEFKPEGMNKLAFMCATGSGKTLITHANILQFSYYLKRAQRLNSHLTINKVILLSPNEGMSNQHLEELKLSSITAALFQKDTGFLSQREDVIIIDMNKLKEEGKIKTVSIDSFEQNNLVLVDEAHRGLAGDVWYDYRSRLSADGGFAFEYSATFKQAMKTLKPTKDKDLLDEYCTSIIMDYSYKYFYEDGYGKEYRIYNLKDGIDEEQRHLYLTGCLLSFYQQLKLFESYPKEFAPFEIEKPLLVFVGNRVTAKTSNAEMTDVEEVIEFIDKFVNRKAKTIERLNAVLNEDTGLMDGRGAELFSQDFNALKSIFGGSPKAEDIYTDILRLVFNSDTSSEEPRLHIENIRQVPGEIGLKIGEYGDYFGVISIGDTAGLVKNCDKKGIVAKTEEFVSESLFRNINNSTSNIKVLVGSRKFTEGWNSWRVSTMGLINFAKGEGSQAIQLFGRGVRLRGYHGCLKRSRKLDDQSINVPKHIELLETLTIFGIRAQYMEDFKKYLELEEMSANEKPHEFTLPVVSRYDMVKEKKLRVIKLKSGVNFKKQSRRLVLDKPDERFMSYLVKNKITIDCRSKVQTIESSFSMQMMSVTDEHTLDKEYIPYLDYDRMFEELEAYKNEKFYYNISIEKDRLKDILLVDGWYSLIIPKMHIKIDSFEKLEAATDYCVMVMKIYIDKFFKYEKERWEAPFLEYQELTADDNNFVSEYSLKYADLFDGDNGAEQVEGFITELTALLDKDKGIAEYERAVFSKSLVAFDFHSHLYAPLISLKSNGLKIQISPVSLNEDEKLFVDRLKNYTEKNKEVFDNRNLYLLRNKSKVGMGFFEAGNFYPDYVLWIDTPEVQYVSFIDPKGLMRVRPDDPKVEFYRKIKELEDRLQPSCTDKKIVLNSFIMSGTKSADLREWWQMSKPERESKHVLCLDNDDCIDIMVSKILD
ncbi:MULTISPECIES: DEAD/DEAH box helicase family protein [Clostridia]|uniref:Type III restriction enzyme, res subunit n=2 Tax=Clostridia TaxID=186801 RepID=A0A0P8W4D6_9CLOT|nr:MULTISPECIES: DEAD/DEAH box helicase family protein [Clostridia]KPU43458.1 type III restriction enzyme, res subunit [Oxobacter pfennigii]WAJ25165.1 DEAD/DEAH box helicase family protein [Lacrimispora xylanolytica]